MFVSSELLNLKASSEPMRCAMQFLTPFDNASSFSSWQVKSSRSVWPEAEVVWSFQMRANASTRRESSFPHASISFQNNSSSLSFAGSSRPAPASAWIRATRFIFAANFVWESNCCLSSRWGAARGGVDWALRRRERGVDEDWSAAEPGGVEQTIGAWRNSFWRRSRCCGRAGLCGLPF